MCGVSGFISKSPNAGILPAFINSLHHRGPDSKGYEYFTHNGYKIGLGHTRLSIIDLSDNASQPFISRNSKTNLVYNGEIYNYKELKKKVKQAWRTTSDTEVLCEGFSIYGVNFLNDINGMFAFAAWDKNKSILTLARDRIGIKPLFYYHDGEQFIFASELKAFTQLHLTLSINQQAIYDFLHLGYIPSKHSIFNEIKKVLPGEYIECHFINDQISLKHEFYWKAEDAVLKSDIGSFINGKNALSDILHQSVKRHLVSDVEVGSFLSGGIDSSLVTALAQQTIDRKIKTFSIGFDDPKHSELPFAQAVANHIGTDHHEFVLSEQDAMDQIENLLDVYDEPFADSSAIPTLLVSQMAAKHVKVALSGDGGDELFLGYGMHNWADRLDHPLTQVTKPLLRKLLKAGNFSAFKKGYRMLDYKSEKSIKSHIFSQEQQLFSESELNRLLIKRDSRLVDVQQNFQLNRSITPAEQQAFFDLKYYLPDDLLVKVDRASMHHSLEVRVPLLDHEVIVYSLNLSRKLKLKNGERKWLLKSVLFDLVPERFFRRPKKGFSIPLEKWLQSDLSYLIDKYLSTQVLEETNIVNNDYVNSLIHRFRKGENFLYNQLWALICLHKFFTNHFNLKS